MGVWKDFNVAAQLKEKSIYDPDNVEIVSMVLSEPSNDSLPDIQEVLKLKGNSEKGKITVSACKNCHMIKGEGVEYGPDITNFAKSQGAEVLLKAIMNPSAEIAHGYEGSVIRLDDGRLIQGMIVSYQDPVIIKSQGAFTQLIPKSYIKKIEGLDISLMPNYRVLGLKEEDLVDIVAYLSN